MLWDLFTLETTLCPCCYTAAPGSPAGVLGCLPRVLFQNCFRTPSGGGNIQSQLFQNCTAPGSPAGVLGCLPWVHPGGNIVPKVCVGKQALAYMQYYPKCVCRQMGGRPCMVWGWGIHAQRLPQKSVSEPPCMVWGWGIHAQRLPQKSVSEPHCVYYSAAFAKW